MRSKWPFIAVAVQLFPALCAIAFGLNLTEPVIMKVIVNQEDKGEYILLMAEDGDPLLSFDDLMKIGFRGDLGGVSIEGKQYLSLRSLAPKVTFVIAKGSNLEITADPHLLQKQQIDIAARPNAKVLKTSGSAAFLNYSLGYQYADGSRFIQVPWEFGISSHGVFGFSDFRYTRDAGNRNQFVRLNTSITRDDPENQRRLVLGDFSAVSGDLGSGGFFGGISFSKNYAADPYFIRVPGLNLSGLLRTASNVELYVNDVLVRTERLSAGEFEFSNVWRGNGAGQAMIVITDDFGRQQRIFVPFYLSSTLLQSGIHDYSYNFGAERNEFGIENFKYGSPAFIGFHRYGFSKFLTAGARAEFGNNVWNAGPSVTFLAGNAGEISASMAFSRNGEMQGYAGAVDHVFITKKFSSRFSLKAFSAEFATLAARRLQERKPRLQVQAGFGVGPVSFRYLRSDHYDGTALNTATVSYSRHLFQDLLLTTSIARVQDTTVNYEFFAGLSLFIGRNKSANFNYRQRDHTPAATVSLQQNPPTGRGIGYRILGEWNDQAEGADASLQYKSNHASYTIGSGGSFEHRSFDIRVAGALAFIDGSVHFSRPITDSFALVKVGSLKDVTIFYNNEPVGATGGRGTALVPTLISYLPNRLSIDETKIPVDVQLSGLEKYVAPPLRGGSILDFQAVRFQAFEGLLTIRQDGLDTPAEYGQLKIQLLDRFVESVLGKEGMFYLENIPVGKFPATISLKSKTCVFELQFPDRPETIVDLGLLRCEIRNHSEK